MTREEAVSKRVILDAILSKISKLNAQGEKAIPIAREFIRFKRFVDGITPIRPEAVQGEWGHMIADGTDGSHWYEYECSHCGEVVLRPYNFCPNCGARMYKGGEEYEKYVEQMEHDIMYEPTYNSEDGSM